MKTSGFFKKTSSRLFNLLILVSSLLFAKETTDYIQRAESGTASEIETVLKQTSGLVNQTFGTNKETMLMIALKNDRSIDVIDILIKYGCKLDAKGKAERTPVMVCARFTTKVDVLTEIITSGTFSDNGKKKRVLAKDKLGKTSFDYARKNPVAEVYQELLKYAADPGEVNVEEETPAQVSDTTSTASTKKADATNIHTVTATFSSSAPVDTTSNTATPATDTAVATTSATTSTAPTATVAATTSAVASTVSVTAAATTTAVAATTSAAASPVPVTATASTTTAASTIPATAAVAPATQATDTTASTAATSTVQPYNKSYLYEYMNDTTPSVPKEDDSTAITTTITDVNLADKNGVTLLMEAAKAGNDWAGQHLLNSGADVQSRDKDGWSALMYAVRYQNSINIGNMLIEKGAQARVRNNYNATPLLLAANYSQNPQILSLLLRNRSATEDEVFKAFILSLTSTEGSEFIEQMKVQLFLDMGVSVNRVWKGKTPLMYAAQYSDSTGVIGLLIQAGAKPGAQNVEGKTAFDFAKDNSRLAHDDIYWSLNSVTK